MKLIDILLSKITQEEKPVFKITQKSKLEKIKQLFPEKLKSVVFGKYNPFYVYFIFLQISKHKRNSIELKHNIFSRDFVEYIRDNQNTEFVFEDFYIAKDMFAINRYIKYRILCGINPSGYTEKKINFFTNKEITEENQFDRLKQLVKKKNNYYEFFYNKVSYKLPINRIDPYIYSERYGISYLPEGYIQKLEGKIFIDIGAFIGDTALMLNDYKPSKIICYEPDNKNLGILKKTIELNGLDNIVEIRDSGLSDVSGEMNIIQDNASSKIVDSNTEGAIPIQVSTLDIDFKGVSNIGLLKMDVEGFERFVLKGGETLIKNNKPVLLISLYHTGADFFEIPPLLRSYSSSVKFRFIDINPYCKNLGEKILIAYF